MRRLTVTLFLLFAMPAAALPVLADEGDPLAKSVMLSGTVGWIMVGLAVVMMLLLVLWTRRGPHH